MNGLVENRVNRLTKSRRRGFNLTEVIVACAIAVVAMMGIAQLMYQVARQYRVVEGRNLVALEAANIMEDLMSRSWEEIAADEVPVVELSPACLQAAPDAELKIDIQQGPDEAEARRITVTIQWLTHVGQPTDPIQLVAWKYRT